MSDPEIVDVVADLGCDPTGREDCVPILNAYMPGLGDALAEWAREKP